MYAFSAVEDWGGHAVETDEVYLLRGTLDGANVRTKSDVQDVAAVGAKAAKGFGLDLRGVALKKLGVDRFEVAWAFTSKIQLVYLGLSPSLEEVNSRLRKGLQPRFPFVDVNSLRWEEVNDSEPIHPSLDFWRFQPVLWDTPTGWRMPMFTDPVPTDAWARFEGLFQGDPLEGHALVPWPEEGEPGMPPEEEKSKSNMFWVLGFGAFLVFAYHHHNKEK